MQVRAGAFDHLQGIVGTKGTIQNHIANIDAHQQQQSGQHFLDEQQVG